MKLIDIMDMADKDLAIDGDKLDTESISIPNLHGKYMRHLVRENLVMKNHLAVHKELEVMKYKWYSGKLSKEELKEMGWDQFPHVISATRIKTFMEGDADLNKSRKLIDLQEQKIAYLESTLKSILTRHWYIRTAVDWRKFQSGVG